MDKHAVAAVLEEIGVLLNLKGENPFKVRAYHNAARSIEAVEEDLETIIQEDRLKDLAGIGEKIAEKVKILVLKGRLPYYEKLKKSLPAGLIDLLNVPGLGGKKIKVLYQKLKIKSMDDLAYACKRGKVAQLAGFGKKSEEKILNGLEKIKIYGRRMLWIDAERIARPILEKLLKLKEVQKVEIAGSFRRKLETIRDLDFLVSSNNAAQTMKWFAKQSWVEKTLSSGPKKSSFLLKQGTQVDLRIIPQCEFGFALLYFTGSKEHNIHMRKRANKRGFSLSEYALEPLKSKKRVVVPKVLKKKNVQEEDIFASLGLEYIPPELREDMGEIEAAETDKLPSLVECKDICGVFHCHTTESDGHNTLEEMVAEAQKIGLEYIGIADHSKSSFQANGMDEGRLLAQIKRIQALNRSRKYSPHVFAGLECDILKNGKLDFPNEILKELDYVIASVHRSFTMDEKGMTERLIKAIENPYTTMVGHVTGRLLLERDPYPVNLIKVIDACIANGKIMELNAQPLRLEMDWRLWRRAKEKGLKCCINPDAHYASDIQYYRLGVQIARKGWLEKKDIVNTLSLKKMKNYLLA